MSKILKYPLIIVFALFIAVFTIVDIAKGDKSFSELENRYLQQEPKLTVASLFDNSYSAKYELFINDQFIGRDTWITIKSRTETVLGKQENNGVVYGKDNYMFERFDTLDTERLQVNLQYVQEYIDLYDTPMTFAVIPNSYMILRDKLPLGLISIDQFAYIQEMYDSLKSDHLSFIDFSQTLQNHSTEDIFYRTDHHWTTLGAYYCYEHYVTQKGKQAVSLDTLKGTVVPDFYGTYFSKAKRAGAQPDIITYYDIPGVTVEIDGTKKDGLYDSAKWNERDKYAGFLYGNNGLTVLKSTVNLNKTETPSRILVIKDSYANSFVPYLAYSYDEIYVVDLRSLGMPMKELMASTQFDDVLIMYNFMNFVSDTNIAKLRY